MLDFVDHRGHGPVAVVVELGECAGAHMHELHLVGRGAIKCGEGHVAGPRVRAHTGQRRVHQNDDLSVRVDVAHATEVAFDDLRAMVRIEVDDAVRVGHRDGRLGGLFLVDDHVVVLGDDVGDHRPVDDATVGPVFAVVKAERPLHRAVRRGPAPRRLRLNPPLEHVRQPSLGGQLLHEFGLLSADLPVKRGVRGLDLQHAGPVRLRSGARSRFPRLVRGRHDRALTRSLVRRYRLDPKIDVEEPPIRWVAPGQRDAVVRRGVRCTHEEAARPGIGPARRVNVAELEPEGTLTHPHPERGEGFPAFRIGDPHREVGRVRFQRRPPDRPVGRKLEPGG